MNYADVEARYRELKARVAAGWLTEDDFKAQLEELMIQDDQGRWWIIGYETGDWYVFDGKEWVQAEPPAPAPAPPIEVMPKAPPETHAPPVIIEPPAESRPPVSDGPGVGVLAGLRVTPMPAADEALPPLRRPAPEPGAGRVSFLESLKAPWLPVLIMAVGWGLGSLLGFAFSRLFGGHGPLLDWSLPNLLFGLIGGAAVMWACRWRGRAWHWSRAAVLAAGWGVVWALVYAWLGSLFTRSWEYITINNKVTADTVGALAGGLLTAAVLRWTGESLTRRQIAIIALGWAAAGVGTSLLYSVLGSGPFPLALANLIFGAIGGWIMLTQLVRARRGAGEAPVAAAAAPKLSAAPATALPAAAWLRWTPVAIIAAGWGIGLLITGLIMNGDSEYVPVGLALAMILGGAATAFVCRREGVALRWYHVLVLLLISPWLIGLVLRWADRRFRWRQVAILFVAWAVAAGIGLGVAQGVVYTLFENLMDYSTKGFLEFVVLGLVAGGLGGWATVDQLARALRRAGSAG